MNATAQAILDAKDRVHAKVSVPEWPDEEGKPAVCRVRSWTGGDRAAFEAESSLLNQHLSEADRIKIASARVTAWCLVDENGKLLFELPKIDRLRDAARDKELNTVCGIYFALAEKNSKALERICAAASELNGVSEDTELEIEKN